MKYYRVVLVQTKVIVETVKAASHAAAVSAAKTSPDLPESFNKRIGTIQVADIKECDEHGSQKEVEA